VISPAHDATVGSRSDESLRWYDDAELMEVVSEELHLICLTAGVPVL
jgi:hypothetical protein